MTEPSSLAPTHRRPDADPKLAATRGLPRRAVLGGAASAALASTGIGGLIYRSRTKGLPMFDGATTWLNSKPLASADLRGRVVLVDFWTFTCINWIRTAPHRRAWAETYRDQGLTVIGVHTPEFSFERDIVAVRREVEVRRVEYPVVVDNDYAIWDAFNNNYWPALYAVDREGKIRDRYIGEGNYEQTERAIQRILGVEREPVSVHGRGVEADPDFVHLRTPETYLGSGRSGTAQATDNGIFRLPATLPLNGWALGGAWAVERECVASAEPAGSIAFQYHARDAHLVLANRSSQPIPFRVLIDGKPPLEAAGTDVDSQGSGLLDEERLYQLVRSQSEVREHRLSITFESAGAEAYAFTFG